ncbi:hypothetical protein GCM10027586_12490 [Kineococcus gypseus]|uniref:hypothetical protein n=1 Tax=Kineococcus gypseus TaxID=1637102 RepID=UPI003D7D5170
MSEPNPTLVRRPAPSREEMRAAFKRSSPPQPSGAPRAAREIPAGMARARRSAGSSAAQQSGAGEAKEVLDAAGEASPPTAPTASSASSSPSSVREEQASLASTALAPGETVPRETVLGERGSAPAAEAPSRPPADHPVDHDDERASAGAKSAVDGSTGAGAGALGAAAVEGVPVDAGRFEGASEALTAPVPAGRGGVQAPLASDSEVSAPAGSAAPARTTSRPSPEKAPGKARGQRAVAARTSSAASAGEGASGGHRTVSKLLVSTHALLSSARKATGRTNTALALLAIDRQAEHLVRLLRASRPTRSGSLFKELPAEVEPRVRVTLDFTPAQVEVIDELARRHGTTRQQLIDVSVAAEYGASPR